MDEPSGRPDLEDTAPKLGAGGSSADAQAVELEMAGASDVGGRESNEDQFLIARFDVSSTVVDSGLGPDGLAGRVDHGASLLMVADGLGGQASGEIASATAVRTILRAVSGTGLGVKFEQVISRAIGDADTAVRFEALGDSSRKGMATTVTAAIVRGAWLVIGHAGDSRAYLMRGGQLERLTRDHTAAQKIAEVSGESESSEQMARLRNVLVNVVGGDHEGVAVDIMSRALHKGDQLVLCSDGLHGVVDDETIAVALQSARSSTAVVEALIEKAIESGTKDNVTVVVAKVISGPEGGDGDETGKYFAIEA